MAQDNKYNGWTNWETWNFNNWFDGSFEEEARTMDRYDLIEYITAYVEDTKPPELTGFYADFLDSALQNINFNEIAESLIEVYQDDDDI